MVNEINSNMDFENQIWESVNELNNTLNPAEFKYIVLGLIFLKYLSDRFEEKYNELIEEGMGFEEDKDEYMAENIFFIPPEARWTEITKKAHSAENGITIDNAMRAIEKENVSLKGILPKTFSNPDINKIKLGQIIDLFTNIRKSNPEKLKNIFRSTFDFCLRKFAEEEGIGPGQFYTPTTIVKIIIAILDPTDGRVYDPCCGSGGFFIQTKNFMEENNKDINAISFYGQEINSVTWKLSKLNLAMNGIEVDLGEYHRDSFLIDLHPTLKADYIVADPHFNDPWPKEELEDDIRWAFGIPPANNANYAWISHMIHHASPNGKIGVIMPTGSLSTSNNAEKKIRKEIIKDDLVEGIIKLPNKLFYGSTIPACLWFLNRDKKQKRKTLFIDASDMGVVSGSSCFVSDGEIKELAKIFSRFQNGELEDKIGFYKVADIEEIEKQDFILVPGRYIGFKSEEDDGIPLVDKLTPLYIELENLFEESHILEDEIKNNLEKIIQQEIIM